jgi:hypothetical protein
LVHHTVRIPPGEEWVKASKAEFQVRFLDGNGNELATIASEPLSTPSTDWQRRVLVILRSAEHRAVETTRLGVGENNEHFHPDEYFSDAVP